MLDNERSWIAVSSFYESVMLQKKKEREREDPHKVGEENVRQVHYVGSVRLLRASLYLQAPGR